MKKILRILIPLLALTLASCGGDTSSDPSNQTNKGTASSTSDSPEITAVAFFEAIYVDNDIKKAQKFVTPSLQRVMSSYHSGKAMGRTLLNMSFDDVVITVEDTNKSVREFYTDKADVMLIFTGTHDGSKQVNMRMVKMVKQKGKWLVNEIKNDPFARTKV